MHVISRPRSQRRSTALSRRLVRRHRSQHPSLSTESLGALTRRHTGARRHTGSRRRTGALTRLSHVLSRRSTASLTPAIRAPRQSSPLTITDVAHSIPRNVPPTLPPHGHRLTAPATRARLVAPRHRPGTRCSARWRAACPRPPRGPRRPPRPCRAAQPPLPKRPERGVRHHHSCARARHTGARAPCAHTARTIRHARERGGHKLRDRSGGPASPNRSQRRLRAAAAPHANGVGRIPYERDTAPARARPRRWPSCTASLRRNQPHRHRSYGEPEGALLCVCGLAAPEGAPLSHHDEVPRGPKPERESVRPRVPTKKKKKKAAGVFQKAL